MNPIKKINIAAYVTIVVMSLLLFNCGEPMIKTKAPVSYIKNELKKLVPVDIRSDLSILSESEKQVVFKLVEAGKIIDQLFLLQVDSDNPEIRKELLTMKDSHQKDYLEMFDIMFGSWNRLEDNKPFLNSAEKPATAGFYPKDMTKEEFQSHLNMHPEDKLVFENSFSVIKRNGDQLIALMYHEAYKDLVQELSGKLREAADLSQNKNLRKFLIQRADDLLTDDYFESDMNWMDLDGKIEVVVGPYEVYEDELFNYKAAYEMFLCIVDLESSEQFSAASRYLHAMETNLPIPDQYKNFNRGSSSPIKIVQEIYTAGDTKAGVQTAAFNLPNDERVREAKGSKKVMLKNITEAKFQKVLLPIAEKILAEKPLKHVSFDCYFNHILMHEISHGLGPGVLKMADGTETTVARELKELYSVIEECKADVLGLYNLLFLMDKGVFEEKRYEAYASYLGGMFRSIRFGIGEAHGGGVAIQFNYLLEKGAYFVNEKGQLDLRPEKIEPVIRELAETVLIIEAEGEYEAAKSLIEKYSVMTPLMENYIKELADLPIDIRPHYEVEKGREN
ncbi:MAG: peptidase [Candidatus Marinimicrobia bacterium]|nr:peptidase [Candidatus Neomarinimicrobiota bacterium]